MLMSISFPSRLGEPCCACESERMRSLAGRPSIVESIVICASTRGAPGTGDGSNKTIRSTLPTRTPASRTSDPSRKPFASAKRAFKCNFRLNGLMSPDALSMRKINTMIAKSTNMPTRSWLKLTLVFVRGMCYFTPSLMSSQKPLDIWILRAAQRFVRAAENHITLAHHHHLAVDETKPLALALENHL